MDEHPQPGLTPIIPGFQRQPGPSPLIPVIVLVIVGTLRFLLLEMLKFRDSFEFEYETYDWSPAIDSFQSQLTFTAVLVPICLLLALITLGIPLANPERNVPPPSPIVKAITENLWGTLLLLVVIVMLVMSIPIRSSLHSPWQQQVYVPPPAPMYTNRPPPVPLYTNRPPPVPIYTNRPTPVPVYTNRPAAIRRGRPVVNGICQELGILKRRCENWTGCVVTSRVLKFAVIVVKTHHTIPLKSLLKSLALFENELQQQMENNLHKNMTAGTWPRHHHEHAVSVALKAALKL